MTHSIKQPLKLPDDLRIVGITPGENGIDELLGGIGSLRHAVWADGGMDMTNSLSNSGWIEEIDKDAYLWAIYDDDRVIASARLTIHLSTESLPEAPLYTRHHDLFPAPIASFNRLVVLEAFRGLKLSHYLDQIRVDKSREIGAKCIALDCPEFRAESLRKRGFAQIGEPIPGIKCPSLKWVVMSKRLR